MDIFLWVIASISMVLLSLISICLAPGIVDYNANKKMLTEENVDLEKEQTTDYGM